MPATPEMLPVKSSNIREMGHDGEHAYVQFHNGGLWRYRDVPKPIYDEWLGSGSVGRYLHEFIRKNHKGEKLL